MILAKKNILAKLLEYEVTRFLIVGGITVLIDLICYFILIYMGFDTFLSKGVSFSVGTVFAYFANRNYTFKSSENRLIGFAVFTLLYTSTLLINIFTNEFVLNLTSLIDSSLMLAFLCATSLSATINFLGMKYIVFRTHNQLKQW